MQLALLALLAHCFHIMQHATCNAAEQHHTSHVTDTQQVRYDSDNTVVNTVALEANGRMHCTQARTVRAAGVHKIQ